MEQAWGPRGEIRGTRLILLLGLAGFVSAADNWVVASLLPAMAEELNVSVVRAGSVLTAYLIPYGLMQPVYGFFSDRRGKAAVLRVVTFGLAVGTLGCVFAPTLAMLDVWRAVTGFFAAGIIAVSLALIGDVLPPEQRARGVGLFMGMVFLGQGASSGLGGLVTGYMGWRAVFACLAGIAALTCGLFRRLPSGLRAERGKGFFRACLAAFRTPQGRVIFPAAFAVGFLVLGLYSYLGAFLRHVVGLGYTGIGLVVMGYGLACFAAGSQVGRIAARIGTRGAFLTGGGLALGACLLLRAFPCLAAGVPATVCLGAGYICMQSTLATRALDVAGRNRGLPSALVGLGLFGGGGVGTWAAGLCLRYGGYDTLWMAWGTGLLALMLMFRRASA